MSEKAIEESTIAPHISNGTPGDPLHFPHKDYLEQTKSTDDVILNAQRATEKEHKMTLWQGIKLYPKAVAWSMLISTCICMEGYDVCLLSNFCKWPHSRGHYDLNERMTDWGLNVRRLPTIPQEIRSTAPRRQLSDPGSLAGRAQQRRKRW